LAVTEAAPTTSALEALSIGILALLNCERDLRPTWKAVVDGSTPPGDEERNAMAVITSPSIE
jgi:hypothetical protein